MLNMNMNMNPMMGNINPMGMNNQLMTNFAMDDTALKIKAIIEPYEKKITELEQIIKQKDFQIVVLNQKLNEFKKSQINMNNNMNMNMMDPMMMNNNMINPMMMNNNIINNNGNWKDFYNNFENNNMNMFIPDMNNNNINNPIPKMNIFIKYKEKEYNEPFNIDENTGKFFRRFCRKLGIKFKNCKFIMNQKSIPPTLTFAESGVENNSHISIIEVKSNNNSGDSESEDDEQCECEGIMKNIIFQNTTGHSINIIISPNHSLLTLLKKYLARIGITIESAKNSLFFTFNGCWVNFDKKTKIKDFFKYENKVLVFDRGNLKGV